jgi:hypothetical protein
MPPTGSGHQETAEWLPPAARRRSICPVSEWRLSGLNGQCWPTLSGGRATPQRISHCRRLARDFERHVRTVVAFVYLAMIRLMLRRLTAKARARSSRHR